MDSDHRPLNPWFSIWTRPRATIQQIIDTDPTRMVILLAALSGISQTLDRASFRSVGDTLELPTILLIALIAGPIGGILSLYIGGALIRWTGSWIGGTGTSENLRAAIAWSSVPVIWILPLWIPVLGIYGEEMFTTETPRLDASLKLLFLLVGIALFEVAIGVWSFVILLKCIGQVHEFSAWRALGNVVLAFLLIVVPLLITVLAIVLAAAAA